MFKINRKKTGSINDGGRNLKIGTHAYNITSAALTTIKSDPTGKGKHIAIGLALLNDPSYNCNVFLRVLDKNDTTREIAERTLVGFFDAVGASVENITPETLKVLVNKTVVIEAVETKGKGETKDKTYTNIRTIEAFDGSDDGEDEEEEEEEDDEDGEEDGEEEEESDDGEDEDDDEDNDEEDEDDAPEPVVEDGTKGKKAAASKAPAKAPSKKASAPAKAPAKKGGRPW